MTRASPRLSLAAPLPPLFGHGDRKLTTRATHVCRKAKKRAGRALFLGRLLGWQKKKDLVAERERRVVRERERQRERRRRKKKEKSTLSLFVLSLHLLIKPAPLRIILKRGCGGTGNCRFALEEMLRGREIEGRRRRRRRRRIRRRRRRQGKRPRDEEETVEKKLNPSVRSRAPRAPFFCLVSPPHGPQRAHRFVGPLGAAEPAPSDARTRGDRAV